MDVRLAYGETGLMIRVPDERATIVEPEYRSPAPDPMAALRTALREPVAGPPLRQLARPGQKVAISVCDGTRAQPRHQMVPAVLGELDGIVDVADVVVLIATGTHRANTDAELRTMLGDDVVDAVRVVNHDARDDSTMTWCGRFGHDVPVWLNSEWVAADLKITTGFVEPHFFAGFSGGPKLVAPGLAALETVLTLHNAARIGHPKATWGITEGNPIHDDVRAIAAVTGVDFACDVVLNKDQKIVEAFAGELFAMHAAACQAARRVAMRPVLAPFDVVVTTNSGYPLDQNLYQSIKGISAGAQIVADSGTIICAAECRDGLPNHGSFMQAFAGTSSPREVLAHIESASMVTPDQWQAQVQAKIQGRARVIMHTDYLTDEILRAAHLEQTADVSAAVAEALDVAGPDARVAVLPEGPQTIPYLAA